MLILPWYSWNWTSALFCSTKYGQACLPAKLGSGICMGSHCGTMEGLEASHVSTLTPYLAVFLLTSKKKSRAELPCMGGLWVWEWVWERVGLDCGAFYSTGKWEGKFSPTLLPAPWIAGATKASSKVLVFSNIRAAGKMRVRNGREITSWLHTSTLEILIAPCAICLVVLWQWVIACFCVGSDINIVKVVLPTVNPADNQVLQKLCNYVDENR